MARQDSGGNLPTGTRVFPGGRERAGRSWTVMRHQPMFSRTFPVRYDDCFWEVCGLDDVVVLEGSGQGR